MAASKPSKKQRGKLKAVSKSKKPEIGAASESSAVVATPKTHVKFDDNGEAVVPSTKKRSRAADSAAVKSKKSKKGKDEPAEQSEGGGKADRSPEMIQQARYYLEQWKRRDEPVPEGELPWKFKKIKQQWVLRWMYEADVVPKSMFSLVLEYLGGIQGAARKRVLESAHEIIDAGVPEKEGEDEEESMTVKLGRRRYKRALQVAELLAE